MEEGDRKQELWRTTGVRKTQKFRTRPLACSLLRLLILENIAGLSRSIVQSTLKILTFILHDIPAIQHLTDIWSFNTFFSYTEM